MDYVDLRVVKRGTEEATLSNLHQPIPLRIDIVVRRTSPSVTMSVTVRHLGSQVCETHGLLLLRNALASGAKILMTNLETQASYELRLRAGLVQATPPEVLRTLEELCLIQTETGVRLSLEPDFRLSDREIATVHAVASILTTGHTNLRDQRPSVDVTKRFLEGMLRTYDPGQPVTITHRYGEVSVQLLGTEIPLGPARRVYHGVLQTPVSELRRTMISMAESDIVSILLSEASVSEEFYNWIRASQVTTE